MSQKLNEYFVGEAGEYLAELERQLAGTAADLDQVVRLATGVRGAVAMAGAESVARLAGRLESAARSALRGESAWDEVVSSLARNTVGELQALTASIIHWGTDQEETVNRAIDRWEDLPNQPPSRPQAVPIESLLFDDEARPLAEQAQPTQDATAAVPIESLLYAGESGPAPSVAVPIESLLFTGEAALREAISLRPAFDAILRGDAADDRTPAMLVDELFDLLGLATGAGSPGG
jgi:HPt (histidine-containing phosphotransfer) domain-containing protein